MRRLTTFTCETSTLFATIDDAPGDCGLLIVSGGNEVRIGAHRGMAKLARDVALAGFPVFRFDRRGIGDSEGENGSFETSGPDISTAIAAFRSECPSIKHLVCFGNCDAATALVLSEITAKHLVLANPWVIEPTDELPPPAAIRARYLQRIQDPKAWARLFSGAIDFRKAISGLMRVASPQAPSSLAADFAAMLSLTMLTCSDRATVLLASHDATALAFSAEWKGKDFAEFRNPDSNVTLIRYDSVSHSFAGDTDYALLKSTILRALAED
jgi:exosortase A-associated hydrolase 1